MKRLFQSSLLWGFLLLLAGIALLTENLIDFPLPDLLWAIAAGIFGIGFIYYAWKEPVHWWRWLAGAGLIGIAVSAFIRTSSPALSNSMDGSEFLASFALAFLLVYVFYRKYWWAVIPAGVLATFWIIEWTPLIAPEIYTESIFFIGLGLTFVVVGLLPGIEQKWGYVPGAILLALGLLLSFEQDSLFDLAWPIGLILGGLYLVYRALRPALKKA